MNNLQGNPARHQHRGGLVHVYDDHLGGEIQGAIHPSQQAPQVARTAVGDHEYRKLVQLNQEPFLYGHRYRSVMGRAIFYPLVPTVRRPSGETS